MKKIYILLLISFSSLLFFTCRNEGRKTGQNPAELTSTRSLGLAYLEEFKLDEAEKTFQKFIKLSPDDKFGYANLGLTYLRMGKYPEAKTQLAKAIKIDPADADIRLILATVYQMNDERMVAIKELKDALSFAPDHIKVLYDLSELYATETDTVSLHERDKYLRELVSKAPGNLVPYLSLTEILIKNGELKKAVEELEIIRKQFPEFPKEATDYYDRAINLLRKGDKEKATVQFTIFHNYMKVTSPYQAGIMDLKGPGGSLIGFPLITFDQQASTIKVEKRPVTEMMKFTDATRMAGLELSSEAGGSDVTAYMTHAETGDYDGDGDIDIYAGSYDPVSKQYRHYLFNNEMGKYKDVTEEAGLRHNGKETSAIFADYDNDGFPDLYILTEGGDILYRNTGKGTFQDVTNEAKVGSKTGGKKALFADLDHDGDLDIIELTSGANLVFRNNSDGTFLEQAEKMGLAGKGGGSSDVVFGDFDDDGDLDLLISSEKDGNALYSNQRQGFFKDVTEESGLKETPGSAAIAAGDYDNDGYLDIFTGSSTGNKFNLYHNKQNGTFEKESDGFFKDAGNSLPLGTVFFDFDNDGFTDIAVAGEPQDKTGQGLFLFHNEGNRTFKNVSELLPPEVKSGREISVFDYNDDGDPDFILSAPEGGIKLLRNDGGNTNHFIKMKLVGLRAGSAKNNHFGIGAKVEMRAGDLYQTMVVTQPDVLFGIDGHTKVDVIRITWTNGVPQNIFFPGADQSLIEAQMLKGSCPFLYAWDGEKYNFSKDIIWRSALGMPTGIMGGETSYAFPDASDDYIKIPGESLKPVNGQYKIQVTSELWETIFIDKLQLVTVDHPDSLDVFVAEQFTPPPFPGKKIYAISRKIPPVSATDDNGVNVLQYLIDKDDSYLADFNHGKYQGVTDMHDLVLDPGNKLSGSNFFMFMNGWIFPTDASINVSISQSSDLKVVTPLIQVIGRNGEWVTVENHPGFPMGKDKTMVIDLSGKFPTPDHRIRIRTNMEIYWDQIFFSDCISNAPVVSNIIDASSADLHYRGFSRMYRKGGPDGPHWFDYSDITKGSKWRDLTGNYTRYGDVLPLIKDSDNEYIITNAGDETSVTFPESGAPGVPIGWKRDYLIHSVGWVKDGDLNTATGNTVMPLPFHGMKSFPPGRSDIYPDTPELRKYNQIYNTRVVTTDDFKNAVRESNNLVVK